MHSTCPNFVIIDTRCIPHVPTLLSLIHSGNIQWLNYSSPSEALNDMPHGAVTVGTYSRFVARILLDNAVWVANMGYDGTLSIAKPDGTRLVGRIAPLQVCSPSHDRTWGRRRLHGRILKFTYVICGGPFKPVFMPGRCTWAITTVVSFEDFEQNHTVKT